MAGYIGPIPVPQATQSRETFTATASQTSFGTAGYQVGYLDVFMNGVKLAPADFTATNGSDVVLASGAAVNDIIEVVSYSAFEVLNQNFTGTTVVDNLTVGGNLTVDGTTTTINSTTLNVDDINITVASGAADSAAANGAGLTVDGAGATFNYSHSGTKWTMNKPLDVGGNLDVTGTLSSDGLTVDSSSNLVATLGSSGSSAARLHFNNTGMSTAGDTQLLAQNNDLAFNTNGLERMRITSAGIVEMYGNGASTLYLKSSSPILAFTDTNSFPDANDRFQIRGTSSDGLAAGSMGFYNDSDGNTYTYFTIRDDGKIGIRNSTPTALGLQVGGDPSGTVAPSMSIYLPDGGGTNTSLAIRGGSPTIFFDQTGGGNAQFLMDSADIAFKSGSMQSEGSEIARIRWQGGITFNGDTAAANALDDYEEGTWTPAFNNVTVSYTERYGKYTKIGDTVHLWGYIVVSSIDNSDTSYVNIGGMPFTSTGGFANGSFYNGSGNASLFTTYTLGAAWTVVSQNYFYLGVPSSTNNLSYAQACNSSGRIWFAMSYPTSS